MSPDDSELLLAYARRGDVASLSALVMRHAHWMMVLLQGLLSSSADAEDVFQETWLKVIRSVASFRGGNVRSYLARVARRTALDRLRRRGRLVSLDAANLGEEENLVASLPASSPTPRESFDLRATAAEIRGVVATLPEGPRQVFLLRLEAEMSFREIAETMEIPLGTALTWMRVATCALRKQLGSVK